ncbi:MAG TPA: hypothetical protein VF657_25230 [Actinoplanes sp.]
MKPVERAVATTHAVDGRDKEIAKRLSELAAHGDSTQLPTSALK